MTGLRMTDPVGWLLGNVVATVRPSATLREASRRLVREHVGLLVVVGVAGPEGVLAERDVVAAVADDVDLDAERVRDHATADLVTIDETATIAEAASAMGVAEIRHLAVERGGEVVGVVSVRDVLAVMVESPDDAELTTT
jgi:CBS domain-containing protein